MVLTLLINATAQSAEEGCSSSFWEGDKFAEKHLPSANVLMHEIQHSVVTSEKLKSMTDKYQLYLDTKRPEHLINFIELTHSLKSVVELKTFNGDFFSKLLYERHQIEFPIQGRWYVDDFEWGVKMIGGDLNFPLMVEKLEIIDLSLLEAPVKRQIKDLLIRLSTLQFLDWDAKFPFPNLREKEYQERAKAILRNLSSF